MSLEEYREEVLRLLREHIKDEEYINKLGPDIEQHYNSVMQAKEILGYDPDPGGYVLMIQFFYPDLPY